MKPEVIAATKLQIWQEIIRQGQYDSKTGNRLPMNPIQAADQAERIYNTLCKVNGAAKRKR